MKIQATIMIPAYNAERFLLKTLESAINQSYKYSEILLIDDGSKDKTLEIAKSYRNIYPEKIKIIHQKNKGIGNTRNRLLKESLGDILLSLDSDDILHPNAVESVVEAFEKNPKTNFIYTDQTDIDEQENVIGSKSRAACHNHFNDLIYHCHFSGHLRAFRKSLLKGAEFDSNLRTAEDWDFLFKLLPNIEKTHIPKKLYFYRVNSKGISLKDKEKTIDTSLRLIKKYIREHNLYGYDKTDILPINAGNSIFYYDHIINGKSTMKAKARQILERYLREGY